MTVRLQTDPNGGHDVLRSDSAYHIQPSGVLTIVVEKGTMNWRVLREYSPSGWVSVAGRRYFSNPDGLRAVDDDDDYMNDPYDVNDSVF